MNPCGWQLVAGTVYRSVVNSLWKVSFCRAASVSRAISRTVETCSGSCRPVGLQKCVAVIPSSAAFWFIRDTKASSLPLTSRASASQHSAPEGSMAPYSRSRTVAVSPA